MVDSSSTLVQKARAQIRAAWLDGKDTVEIDGVLMRIRHFNYWRKVDGEQKDRSYLVASPAGKRAGFAPRYNVALRP